MRYTLNRPGLDKTTTITSNSVDSSSVTNNTKNATAIERITEHQRNLEGGSQFQYLVRGATLRCSFGSRPRRLNLPLCNGVYVGADPVLHDHDCVVGEEGNISPFGSCSSPSAPVVQTKDNQSAEGKSCNYGETAAGGNPCEPVIVGDKWLNGHPHTMIADNTPGAQPGNPESRIYYPALTTDSFLVCKYGGLIEPQTSGQ